MSNSRTGVVVGPGEGNALSIIGVDGGIDTYTEKVLGSSTEGAYTAFEVTMRGQGPPLHVHADLEEAFYVVEGEVEFEVDGKTTKATPGTFILSPRGVPHKFRLVSPEPAKLFKIISPPGFEKFLEDIDGESDLNRILEASKKYNTEWVEPPPA